MVECPRWKLLSAHYLNIPELPDGTKVEWEHKETNKQSGRAVRKLFVVPMYLNPEDPADHNHPGEIIVTHEVEGGHPTRGDLIFTGNPTQEMEPLNDAAEAISASLRAQWIDPVNAMPTRIGDGMSPQEKAFFDNMMAAFSRQQPPQVDNTSVSREAYDELQTRLAKLESMLAAQNKAPEPTNGRRA